MSKSYLLNYTHYFCGLCIISSAWEGTKKNPSLKRLVKVAQKDIESFVIPPSIMDIIQKRDSGYKSRQAFADAYKLAFQPDVDLHSAIVESNSVFFKGNCFVDFLPNIVSSMTVPSNVFLGIPGKEFETVGPPVPLGPLPYPITPAAHKEWAKKPSFLDTSTSTADATFHHLIVSHACRRAKYFQSYFTWFYVYIGI
jgi:hypothetical protein